MFSTVVTSSILSESTLRLLTRAPRRVVDSAGPSSASHLVDAPKRRTQAAQHATFRIMSMGIDSRSGQGVSQNHPIVADTGTASNLVGPERVSPRAGAAAGAGGRTPPDARRPAAARRAAA